MRFILRMTFWLGLVLALLPSAGSQPTPTLQVSATDAMSAARATMADMRQFCERQQEACSVGTQAVVAVGHQILEIAFYIMGNGVTYDELGADYFDRRHAERAVRRHIKQLEALGFHVTIEKAA